MNGQSHFVPHDAREDRGHRARAICGELIPMRDHNNTPTCHECRAFLEQTAEDVFGPPPVGTQVRSSSFDVMAGYRPKGAI